MDSELVKQVKQSKLFGEVINMKDFNLWLFVVLWFLILISSSLAFLWRPSVNSQQRERVHSARRSQCMLSGNDGSKIIATYTDFPHTMFRLLNSKTPSFKAREKTELPGSFDIVVTDGVVHPLVSDQFMIPNGASVRPNTVEEYYLVCSRSRKSFLCEIPQGTKVPTDCVLVHEFGDHFSLQPKKLMSIQIFNKIISEFLLPCRVYMRDEWLGAHPLGSQITV